MIAVDTSTLIAYLAGEWGEDAMALDDALSLGGVCLPPVVVTEILTDARTRGRIEAAISGLRVLTVTEGYWRRAGHARAALRQRGYKARLADTLISQSCVDHDVPLLTRDADFRHFAKHCGLRLA